MLPRGGIASFAISALDIAFWDIELKTKGLALKDLYGTGTDRVRTYYGGIDLMLSETELLNNIEKQLMSGHTAVKIKLGKENEDEDIARVKAVRKLIGKDALFMVDANMICPWNRRFVWQSVLKNTTLHGWKNLRILMIMRAMQELDRQQPSRLPWEKIFTRLQNMNWALKIGRISCPIPDCSNVCGITGFMKVAKMAEDYSLKVHSHGMQELHGKRSWSSCKQRIC